MSVEVIMTDRAVAKVGSKPYTSRTAGPARLTLVLTAYVDESGGSGFDLENVYILAATIPLCADPGPYRAALRELKPLTARKLHWYEADPGLRVEIVDLILTFEALHVVVESVEHPDTKPERHRRLCMKPLLSRLDLMGVSNVVMESRGAGSNQRDRNMVKMLKTDGTISTTLDVTHRDGPFEPLLWIPDTICGAVVERRIGNPSHLLKLDAAIDWLDRSG